jgi:hypothetical protein
VQVDGTSAKDVMDLLLLTQYFDMIKDIGAKSQSSTLFVPHGPASVARLRAELNSSMHNA